MSELTTHPSKKDDSHTVKDGNGVPSGFVLKLFQMVNGAPDEVISWLPSGDAFRISDLQRLENETLPTFFRHKRFQSLVRQLNFYNFRKVNRERTFWVYRHRLFHRDRPEELHLLRRRTCPGVDGRKLRPDGNDSNIVEGNSGSRSRSRSPRRGSLRGGDGSDYRPSADVSDDNTIQKKRRNNDNADYGGYEKKSRVDRKSVVQNNGSNLDSSSQKTKSDGNYYTSDFTSKREEGEKTGKSRGQRSHLVDDGQGQIKSSMRGFSSPFPENSISEDASLVSNNSSQPESSSDNRPYSAVISGVEEGDGVSDKQPLPERSEQAMLVNKVARQLEAHAKRAAAAAASQYPRKPGRRRAGTVSPSFTFTSDTMKYHALTYDDELEIFDSGEDVHDSTDFKKSGRSAVVTDEDDSEDNISTLSREDSINNLASMQRKLAQEALDKRLKASYMLPPIEETSIISEVVRKLHNWAGNTANDGLLSSTDGQLVAAIAGFCMSTAPHDPMMGEKALDLMSACTTLAEEFRRYKAALCPNSAHQDILSNMKTQNSSLLIKKIFQGDSNEKDTMRIFKTFLLNSLDDLVRDPIIENKIYLTETESESLHKCAKLWFGGVKTSA